MNPRKLTLLALMTACTPAPGDVGAVDPGWSALASLPAPLQECAVVLWRGEIVVVGGIESGGVTTDRVEAYDPAGDRWRSLPSLPTPLHHANAAVVDGNLYVVGHLTPGFGAAGGVYVLEPGEAWEARSPMPGHLARGAAAVGVIDGQIHLVGGLRDGAPVAAHSVYDPLTDTWTELPDSPLPRDHAGAAVIDDVLYVVGGRLGALSAHVALVHAWRKGRWEVRSAMPTSRAGLAVAALDGRLHAVGGEGSDDPSGVFGAHELYDPRTDRWDALPGMATPRHGTGAVGLDGALYVPGGADVAGIGPVSVHEGWRLVRDQDTGR